jgi:hemerythrin HHE cation binding domain-containing protein
MPDAPFDAIALLKAGHRDVEALFARIERPEFSRAEREALAKDIAQALLVQAQLLEEIAFPAFRAAGVHASILDHAEACQYAIGELIGDLQDVSRKDDTFDTRLKSLAGWVKRLIKRTESEMFPEAQSSGADLTAIGLRMAARKAELTAGTEEPLSH